MGTVDMSAIAVAGLFLLAMMGCFGIGLWAQRILREHHRSRDSVDSIRVVITLLVTFAALVLGLLISSTQARFATLEAGLRGLSIDIVELDHRLRAYGPATDPIRAEMIFYTKAAIADTWPDEPPPPGNYPHRLKRMSAGSVESVELSALLARVDLAIRELTPQDNLQRVLAADLGSRITALLDQRLDLIENARPTITWPFLLIMVFWLVVIFLIVGLTSSHNVLVITVMTLAALSLASSIFLALELDTPLDGYIVISSTPLRDALVHLTEPPLPPGAP
jgi:hypothetical protein